MITGSRGDSGQRRRRPSVVVALALLLSALGAPAPARGGLLRVPRVYNALITTDERLLPSRAVSVSAPLLAAAPLIVGPAPVPVAASYPAPAEAPAEDTAPARAAAPAAPPAPAPKEADKPAAKGPATRAKAPFTPLAPATPAVLQLYNPYYSYYPSLLPYSLAPHPLSSLVLFHPYNPAAPVGPAPAGPGPEAPAPEAPAPDAPASLAADPSGRALPSGARDEPEKDAVTVEAN